MTHRSRILGIGMAVPERVVTNHELATKMETSHEWIVERTGIEQRHWVCRGRDRLRDSPPRRASEAIERAGVDPKDIDLIIYATLSPDFFFPGTAVFVQRALGGCKEIPCLDIRQQCTGFIYGLSIADAYIRTGMFKNILLIGSEVHSTGLDVSTAGRDITVLFGDGAGAVVDRPRDRRAAHDPVDAHPRGRQRGGDPVDRVSGERATTRGSTRRRWPSASTTRTMNGKKVFKHAVTRMPQAIMEGMVSERHQARSPTST